MTKKKFNIIFIALLLLPIIAFFIMNLSGSLFGINHNNAKTITAPSLPQIGSARGASPFLKPVRDVSSMPFDYFNNYNNETNTISDTREFMKVNYGSTISTYNDVMNIAQNVKDSVKIFDGRVNNFSANNEYANINFIIPKANLDDFRKKIKTLTNEKLIIENISETNLLNQKVGLENRANTLEANQTQIDKYKSDSNLALQKVNSTKSSITVLNAQLRILDPNSNNYQTMKANLENQLYQAQNKLANYTQDYNLKLSFYNNSVENQKTNTTILAKDNNQFDNNIETVEGYVSVQSVGVLEYLQRMFPFLYYLFNPLSIYFIVVILLYFILRRKVIVTV